MKIDPLSLTARELCEGYADHAEDGVVAYGGRLDIRPKYQREFIYSEKQQQAVVNTAMHGWSLNTMYWAVRGDGTFEVIDGQQRTLSLCRFCEGDFSFPWRGSRQTATCRARAESTSIFFPAASGRARFPSASSQIRRNARPASGRAWACPVCGKRFEFEEMHGDRKTPWPKGGHTTPDNLQTLCRICNLRKGNV